MKNKSRKYITAGIVLFVLVTSGTIFFSFYQQAEKTPIREQLSSLNNNNPPNNSPVPHQLNDNLSPKQILANQIKTDLEQDLEQAKKSDRWISPTYFKSLGECGDCQGERLNFAGVGSSDYLEQGIERRKSDIFPNELEPTDWEEINNLLNQINKLNEEKRERDKKENENRKIKRDEKLKSNQKMFYYEYLDELWEVPGEVYHFFLGIGEDKKEFHLMVPENHPAIDNLPCHKEFPKSKKDKILCLIEGAKNIPYTQHPKIKNHSGFLKWVKLEDKISITPYSFPDFQF